MADGSEKPVEAIFPGDLVMAFDPMSGQAAPSKVVKVHAPYEKTEYLIINESIRLTDGHPMLSAGEWVAAGELRVGDVMTNSRGGRVPVFSVRTVVDEVFVHNFQVEAGTYIADGVVVHNKEDCEDYVQDPCPGSPGCP